jgi:hypothetical protein
MSYPPAGEGTSKCFFTYSSASRNLAEKAKIVKEKVFLEKTSFGKESMRAYKVHSPIRGTYVVDLLPKVIVHEAECETGSCWYQRRTKVPCRLRAGPDITQ